MLLIKTIKETGKSCVDGETWEHLKLSSTCHSLQEIISDVPEWNHSFFVCIWVCVLQVWPPAQIHLTQQIVICGFLYEVVDVSRDGQRQTQYFIPALYHSLQALLDVTHVGFSLAETEAHQEDDKVKLIHVTCGGHD